MQSVLISSKPFDLDQSQEWPMMGTGFSSVSVPGCHDHPEIDFCLCRFPFTPPSPRSRCYLSHSCEPHSNCIDQHAHTTTNEHANRQSSHDRLAPFESFHVRLQMRARMHSAWPCCRSHGHTFWWLFGWGHALPSANNTGQNGRE